VVTLSDDEGSPSKAEPVSATTNVTSKKVAVYKKRGKASGAKKNEIPAVITLSDDESLPAPNKSDEANITTKCSVLKMSKASVAATALRKREVITLQEDTDALSSSNTYKVETPPNTPLPSTAEPEITTTKTPADEPLPRISKKLTIAKLKEEAICRGLDCKQLP
jgi:hypothetical protein